MTPSKAQLRFMVVALLAAGLSSQPSPTRAEPRSDAPTAAGPDNAPTPSASPSFVDLARWTCLLVGASVLGAGATYMAVASDEASRVNGASTDSSGRIWGMTQREAFALSDDAERHRSRGLTALTAGAVLMGAGVIIWMLDDAGGRPSKPSHETVRPYGQRLRPLIDPWVSAVVDADGPAHQTVPSALGVRVGLELSY